LECIIEDSHEKFNNSATILPALKGQLDFKPHGFFTEQPVKNADVYFLRSILHNWSDKYAIEILTNLIPALKEVY
jgi:chemotaxis methyl-accepting protein methylase